MIQFYFLTVIRSYSLILATNDIRIGDALIPNAYLDILGSNSGEYDSLYYLNSLYTGSVKGDDEFW